MHSAGSLKFINRQDGNLVLSQQAQTVRRIFRPFVSAFRVVPTAQRLWVSSYSISVSLSYVDDSIGLILSYFTPEARISQQVSMFLVLTGTLARPRPCRHATAPLAWLSLGVSVGATSLVLTLHRRYHVGARLVWLPNYPEPEVPSVMVQTRRQGMHWLPLPR